MTRSLRLTIQERLAPLCRRVAHHGAAGAYTPPSRCFCPPPLPAGAHAPPLPHISRVPQIGAMFAGDRARKSTLVKHGFRLPSALDNRPLTGGEFWARVPQAVLVSATPGAELAMCGPRPRLTELLVRPTGIVDPEVTVVDAREIGGGYEDHLLAQVEARRRRNERTLVTCLTKRSAEAMSEFLQGHGVPSAWLHSDVKAAARLKALEGLQVVMPLPVSPLFPPLSSYLSSHRSAPLISPLTSPLTSPLLSCRMASTTCWWGATCCARGSTCRRSRSCASWTPRSRCASHRAALSRWCGPSTRLLTLVCRAPPPQGFLRSATSLIQTIGRAARHINGTALLYTRGEPSAAMEAAIEETERRRTRQTLHNQQHGTTPRGAGGEPGGARTGAAKETGAELIKLLGGGGGGGGGGGAGQASGGDDGPGAGLEGGELELYDALRTWRGGVLRSEGKRRPFMIVTEQVMRGIATTSPTSTEELLAVKGIGPKKLEKYGEQLLEVVRLHLVRQRTSPQDGYDLELPE